VERWILHKLSIAATQSNTQLQERNFMAATMSGHNFWLYELRDVYIVRLHWIGLYIDLIFLSTEGGETFDRRIGPRPDS
jgi:isoleucyl-tRNA synthetase